MTRQWCHNACSKNFGGGDIDLLYLMSGGGAKKREEERKYNMIFQLGPAKLNHNIDAHQMNSQRCFLACLVSAKNPHS